MLDRTEFVPVADGERRRIGPFDCQFVPVTHSVPYSLATAYFTPAGTILHTGDFKLDLNPVDGRKTDLALLGEVARRDGGIRLLLSDSTNAERPGFTPSESTVGEAMRDLFRDHPDRRFIVACFASHLHRVEQVARAALASGRQIAFLGRSMAQNVTIAREMGLLDVPAGRVVDIEDAARFAPGKIDGKRSRPCLQYYIHRCNAPCTGWESREGYAGTVADVERFLEGKNDGLAQELTMQMESAAEELKFMLNLTQPERFVPVHGEYRHMVHHARLAREVGLADDRVVVCQDGDVLTLGPNGMDVDRRAVPAGYLYVDGIVGDVGHGVLRDRRSLAEEGVVVVIVTIDATTGEVVTGPEIVTRGWVYAPEADELLEDGKAAVLASLAEAAEEGATDFETIRRHTRRALGRFINERTRRRPAIIPVVMEV